MSANCLDRRYEEEPISKDPVSQTAWFSRPPLHVQRIQVKQTDSWASIATKHAMTDWELIEFNFPGLKSTTNFQKKCREVNWYLHHYVGCTTPTKDRKNWTFSPGSSIYVPGTGNPTSSPTATQLLSDWVTAREFLRLPFNGTLFQCLLSKMSNSAVNDEHISEYDYHANWNVSSVTSVQTTRRGLLRTELLKAVPSWNLGNGVLNTQLAWADLERMFWQVPIVMLVVSLARIQGSRLTQNKNGFMFDKITQLAQNPLSIYHSIGNSRNPFTWKQNCFGRIRWEAAVRNWKQSWVLFFDPRFAVAHNRSSNFMVR